MTRESGREKLRTISRANRRKLRSRKGKVHVARRERGETVFLLEKKIRRIRN